MKELGIEFEDESKIIYINGEYQGNDVIGQLVHDLNCENPDDIYNEVIRNRVKYFKEQEGGKQTMCKVWDDIRKDGKAEGIEEGKEIGKAEGIEERTIESLQQLMANLNLSIEEAFNALGIKGSEKEYYRNLLK